MQRLKNYKRQTVEIMDFEPTLRDCLTIDPQKETFLAAQEDDDANFQNELLLNGHPVFSGYLYLYPSCLFKINVVTLKNCYLIFIF